MQRIYKDGKLLSTSCDHRSHTGACCATGMMRHACEYHLGDLVCSIPVYAETAKSIKVYISGPMAGLPGLNFKAFDDMEIRLHKNGYTVLNPASLPKDLSYADYVVLSLAMVQVADAIITLPDWEKSRGARAEVASAEAIGKRRIHEDELSIV